MSTTEINSNPADGASSSSIPVQMMRPRGRVPHGLEDVERIITAHMCANYSGEARWCADKKQLDSLLHDICNPADKPADAPAARLDYKYEISTCLMHIFLVGEDVHRNMLSPYEERMRSFFVDLSNISDPRVVISQHEQIIYNDDAIAWLKQHNVPWSQVEIQDSIDGTEILHFQHNGTTFNSTTRCMNAGDSKWSRKHSHLHLFKQVTDDKIKGVDPNIVLSIALVHPDNENIIGVPSKYREGTAIIVDARHKYTMERAAFHREAMPTVLLPRIKTRRFESLADLQAELSAINARIRTSKQLDFEGFIIRVYRDTERRFLWKLLKLQTDVFRTMKAIRPNTGSRTEMVIDLYLRGNLNEYARWCSVDAAAKRNIYTAFRTLVLEFHAFYVMTRNKRNPSLYGALTESWKRMIFDVHGIFLAKLDERKSKRAAQVTKDHVATNLPNADAVGAEAAAAPKTVADQGQIIITAEDVEAHMRSRPLREIINVIMDRTGVIQNLINVKGARLGSCPEPFGHCRALETLAAELITENREQISNRRERIQARGRGGNRKSNNPGYHEMNEQEVAEIRSRHAPNSPPRAQKQDDREDDERREMANIDSDDE
jgi:hypothetical protein